MEELEIENSQDITWGGGEDKETLCEKGRGKGNLVWEMGGGIEFQRDWRRGKDRTSVEETP